MGSIGIHAGNTSGSGGGGDSTIISPLGQQPMAASVSIAVASDQTPVPVSAASLPLPADAATETTLATLLTEAEFEARINTLGQKTAANSTPVVLATDQTPLQIEQQGTAVGGFLDADGVAGGLSIDSRSSASITFVNSGLTGTLSVQVTCDTVNYFTIPFVDQGHVRTSKAFTTSNAIELWELILPHGAMTAQVTLASHGAGDTTVEFDAAYTHPSKVVPVNTPVTPSSPAAYAVTAATTAAVAANVDRRGLVLVNTSANRISLGLGASAVLDSGITLLAGGSFVMTESMLYTGTINAIASVNPSNLAIQEFT